MATKEAESSRTAALVRHGVYQYVRLPKEFQFEGNRVQIERRRNGVILTPVLEKVVGKPRKAAKC